MAAAAVGSDDPFLTPGYAWWYSKDDLLAWGFDNDEESFRIVRKVEEVREAQGLFARDFRPSKATRGDTKRSLKTWYFRMPRRDGQLVALQPAFGPKDQLQLVDQLNSHWEDHLKNYSPDDDVNTRQCSVTARAMSNISGLLDALDATFGKAGLQLDTPMDIEVIVNHLVDTHKFEPPTTQTSPQPRKRMTVTQATRAPAAAEATGSFSAEAGPGISTLAPPLPQFVPNLPPEGQWTQPPPRVPPLTHPATPANPSNEHIPWAPRKPGASVSSLQLSGGLREDIPVEVRRRPVVTLQGAADAERVVNSLGKNGGRFAVEVQGLSVLLLLCRGPAQQPRHPYRFHAIILRPGCGRRLRPIRRRFR